ncbi:hypothetical protein [Pseudomonas koreensis]|uniref:hypothetical protein n=1 Tax=Pseudomonas koreensis TaxID=198620 RepID=UPI001387382B|nr:hypothetical protein [Pseudomonas koreensis]
MSKELDDESSSKGVKVVVEPYDNMKVKDSPNEGAVPEKPKEVTVVLTWDEITGEPERK